MVNAHFTLGTRGFKYTLRICNTYCFSTAIMLTRRRPDVTSRHVTSRHVMSCHVMSCHVMLCYVMLCYTHIACRCTICLFMSILITGIFGNIPTWDIVHFSVFKIKITTQSFLVRILPLRNSKKVKENLLRWAQEEKLF